MDDILQCHYCLKHGRLTYYYGHIESRCPVCGAGIYWQCGIDEMTQDIVIECERQERQREIDYHLKRLKELGATEFLKL